MRESGRERERGGAENIITGTPEGQSRTLENTGGRAEVEMTESRVVGGRGPGVEKDGAVAVGLDLGIEIGGKGDPEAEPGAEAGIGTETGKDPMKFAKVRYFYLFTKQRLIPPPVGQRALTPRKEISMVEQVNFLKDRRL